MSETPCLSRHKRHAFICTGESCAEAQVSSELWKKLKLKLKEAGLDQGTNQVRRSQCRCLGVCKDGPILAVYPEDVWYHHVDEAKLDRIIEEHLAGGQPVDDFMFERV
ncbi:MAG: NAD(P)H-dependent oxidoreductase subunit E [Candidatus Omnitrophica bacterium]|nr:NAD(P)H-dependent oxidoreductase subunit E [Candidatus Omnitrophota bacterium]